jgi:hypothetical protein
MILYVLMYYYNERQHQVHPEWHKVIEDVQDVYFLNFAPQNVLPALHRVARGQWGRSERVISRI